MGTYDFDEVIDRRGTGSLKWDVGAEELPMWVADMDLKTAPEIIEALQEKVAEGIYGYQILPEEWYAAYINWWRERHGLSIERDWLVFCTGVVPAISSIIRKLTTPAEKVLVQTPVYNIFFNSIRNNGRVILESPLVLRDGEYEMDEADLEEKLADPQTTLMLLCNPQNPSGRVWSREELAKVGALCHRYGVTVVADEIHCDLTVSGVDYVPFASVDEVCREISISCISPSKAFNLAGLQSAAVVIANPGLRHKVWRGLNTDEVAEPNAFAVTSTVAALTRGAAWLDELREYLAQNRRIVAAYLKEKLPQLELVRGDATYLLWIDARAIYRKGERIAPFLRRETGLYISDGASYGAEGFLRVNIACPASIVREGLERLARGIAAYQDR